MRSARRMEAIIRNLAGITEDEANQLSTAGINNGNDLAQAEFMDIQGVLSEGAQTIRCRRLQNIGKCIKKGEHRERRNHNGPYLTQFAFALLTQFMISTSALRK